MRPVGVVLAVVAVVACGCGGEPDVGGYRSSASVAAKQHVARELDREVGGLEVSMVPEFDGRCGVTVVEAGAQRHVVFLFWEDKHQFRVTDSGVDLEPGWLDEGAAGCHFP